MLTNNIQRLKVINNSINFTILTIMLLVSSKPCNQFWVKMSASTFSRRMEEWYLVSTQEPRLKADSLAMVVIWMLSTSQAILNKFG